MKRTVLLLAFGIMAAALVFAQDNLGNSTTSRSQDQNAQTRTQSTTTQNNTVQGCLSGSPGNYTITDQNGTQWQVTGDDATLRSSVGREVEVRFTQNQSSEESNQGSTTTRTTHSVQASQVTALSSACSTDNSTGTPSDNSMPPKGTPDRTEPQAPRMMAMLLPPQSTSGQSQSQTGSSPQQTTPPVTSQTPANSTSPATGANSQVGTSPANNTGMSESEANHDAQAARQGELNTNPENGQTTGRGIDNQGVNNPSPDEPERGTKFAEFGYAFEHGAATSGRQRSEQAIV